MEDELEFIDVLQPFHDALFILLSIVNCLIKRILVDKNSSVNIIYADTLKEMQVDENKIVRKARWY